MRTLGYAVLGLLSREELSGYDLKRWMERPLGYFWTARHSQIYPELARLEEDGFVTHRVVEQSGKPDKKVYRITAEGLEALKEWVVQPPVSRSVRDELTLKAYSVWLADKGQVARLFREEGVRREEQLAHYETLRTWMEDEHEEEVEDPDSPWFAAYATLRRGIGYEKGYAEWCRWMADSVEGRKSTGKPKKSEAGRK